MTDHVRTLSGLSQTNIACVPNAGLPDEDGNYNESPEMLAATLGRFAENGWLNVAGGCCGTGPDHIRQIAAAMNGKPPRDAKPPLTSRVSGIEAVLIDPDSRPTIIGERTNVLGSRRFKRLISGDRFEEAAEVGRRQVRNGAHILDVCLQDPDRDEMSDVIKFLDQLNRRVKAPIMIDSTDADVIEESLKTAAGQVNHQLHQPRGWRGAVSARGAIGPAATAPRWWWVALTMIPIRHRPSRGSARWKSPNARTNY